MSYTLRQDDFTVSTDPARLDVDAVHAALTEAYWSTGIPRETVERSLRRAADRPPDPLSHTPSRPPGRGGNTRKGLYQSPLLFALTSSSTATLDGGRTPVRRSILPDSGIEIGNGLTPPTKPCCRPWASWANKALLRLAA